MLSNELSKAARSGNIDTATMLLNQKADPNGVPANGDTALVCAAYFGHTAIVKILLDRKANPDIKNKVGGTALACAAEQGHTDIVEILLNAKASVDIGEKEEGIALRRAAMNGHTRIVQILLEHKARPEIQNKNGWTALMLAAASGHTEIVQILLDGRASPDIQNNNGSTPLMWAADSGHTEIVNVLLKHGASPLTKDIRGLRANEDRRFWIKNVLSENQQALISAFKNNNINGFNSVMQTMPALISAPLPLPLLLKKDNWTMPLHLAAENGTRKFFIAFINQLKIRYEIDGQNPDNDSFIKALGLKNFEDKTACDIARNKNDEALAIYIEALVENPRATTAETTFLASLPPPPPPSATQKFAAFVTEKVKEFTRIPRDDIDVAIKNCDVSYFEKQREDEKYLLAEEDWRSSHNAFHTLIQQWKEIKSNPAFENLKKTILQSLQDLPLSKPGDRPWFEIALKKRCNDQTPLELAIALENVEAVKWLLSLQELQFDWINSRNGESLTAFHQAAIKGNKEIVGAILERFPEKNQALIETTCKKTVTHTIDEYTSYTENGPFYGYTALDFAVYHGKFSVVDELLKHGAVLTDRYRRTDHFKQKSAALIDAIAAFNDNRDANLTEIFPILDSAPGFLTTALYSKETKEKGMTALHHAAKNPVLFREILKRIGAKKTETTLASGVPQAASLSGDAGENFLSEEQFAALLKKDGRGITPLVTAHAFDWAGTGPLIPYSNFIHSLNLTDEQKIKLLRDAIKSDYLIMAGALVTNANFENLLETLSNELRISLLIEVQSLSVPAPIFKRLFSVTLAPTDQPLLLNLAIHHKHVEIAKYLLDKQVNPRLFSSSTSPVKVPSELLGVAPSSFALHKQSTEFFALCLQSPYAGIIDINISELPKIFKTCYEFQGFLKKSLEIASANKTPQETKALKAQIFTSKNSVDDTLLHSVIRAAENCKPSELSFYQDLIDYFLENGVDVNAVNQKREKASLMRGCGAQYLQKLITEKEADRLRDAEQSRKSALAESSQQTLEVQSRGLFWEAASGGGLLSSPAARVNDVPETYPVAHIDEETSQRLEINSQAGTEPVIDLLKTPAANKTEHAELVPELPFNFVKQLFSTVLFGSPISTLLPEEPATGVKPEVRETGPVAVAVSQPIKSTDVPAPVMNPADTDPIPALLPASEQIITTPAVTESKPAAAVNTTVPVLLQTPLKPASSAGTVSPQPVIKTPVPSTPSSPAAAEAPPAPQTSAAPENKSAAVPPPAPQTPAPSNPQKTSEIIFGFKSEREETEEQQTPVLISTNSVLNPTQGSVEVASPEEPGTAQSLAIANAVQETKQAETKQAETKPAETKPAPGLEIGHVVDVNPNPKEEPAPKPKVIPTPQSGVTLDPKPDPKPGVTPDPKKEKKPSRNEEKKIDPTAKKIKSHPVIQSKTATPNGQDIHFQTPSEVSSGQPQNGPHTPELSKVDVSTKKGFNQSTNKPRRENTTPVETNSEINFPDFEHQSSHLFQDRSSFLDDLLFSFEKFWNSILDFFQDKSDPHIPDYHQKFRKTHETPPAQKAFEASSFHQVSNRLNEENPQIPHKNSQIDNILDEFFGNPFSSPEKEKNHFSPLSKEDKEVMEQARISYEKSQVQQNSPKRDNYIHFEEPSLFERILRY